MAHTQGAFISQKAVSINVFSGCADFHPWSPPSVASPSWHPPSAFPSACQVAPHLSPAAVATRLAAGKQAGLAFPSGGWKRWLACPPYFLHDSRDSRATAVRQHPIFTRQPRQPTFFKEKKNIILFFFKKRRLSRLSCKNRVLSHGCRTAVAAVVQKIGPGEPAHTDPCFFCRPTAGCMACPVADRVATKT